MNCQLAEQGKPFPFADWSKYGGWTRKKLTEGTGFFSRIKEDNGKWWLVDPLGYAFLSIGPDCVGPEIDCRIDGLEKISTGCRPKTIVTTECFFNPSM